jgi:PiT family inorganic phosphate transporter
MGAGSVRRRRAVRWNVGKQIVFAWIITIPGSALMGIGFTYLIQLFI